MNAIERGQQMMHVPMDQLPEAALKFAAHLCRKFGMCGEVMLSAYITYAQVEEGLPCEDSLYKLTEEHRGWYEEAQRTWVWNKEHTGLVRA
jgi:hypothetical protein